MKRSNLPTIQGDSRQFESHDIPDSSRRAADRGKSEAVMWCAQNATYLLYEQLKCGGQFVRTPVNCRRHDLAAECKQESAEIGRFLTSFSRPTGSGIPTETSFSSRCTLRCQAPVGYSLRGITLLHCQTTPIYMIPHRARGYRSEDLILAASKVRASWQMTDRGSPRRHLRSLHVTSEALAHRGVYGLCASLRRSGPEKYHFVNLNGSREYTDESMLRR